MQYKYTPEELKERVQQCQKLPTLPGAALQILRLCRDGDVDLRKTATVIAKDPALSAKVLKFVNSPIYGLRREVTTLSHAVALLGFNSIRTLALSFSLVRGLRSSDCLGFDYRLYWRRSLISAAAARILGTATELPNHEELFLAALLQDIGMLVLQETLSDEYGVLISQCKGDHARLQQLEMEAFGVDHAEVSSWLVEIWQLPELFRLSLQCSHDPDRDNIPEPFRAMVNLVALSGWLADIWLGPDPKLAYQLAAALGESTAGLSRREMRNVLASISESLPDLSTLFEIEVGDSVAITTILEDAKDQLVTLSLESVHQARHILLEADNLALENQRLRESSQRDCLTGLHNRGYLEKNILSEFERAGQGKCLSVIFCDIDHFKEINDTYGHQTGDRVLRSVAKQLSQNRRQFDIVTRYGGDEFVIVLPNTDRSGASVVANRIQKRIARESYEAGSENIQVTVSAGFATHSGTQPYRRAEELCQAADLALYAAKKSGRNRVSEYEWTEEFSLQGSLVRPFLFPSRPQSLEASS